jgi:hypothetical protein
MDQLAAIIGSLSLAQTSEGPYTPPALPAPPRLANWLFENPWPPAIGLLAFAVLAFFILNSRSQARQGAMIASGLLLAGVACIATAFAVTTDRERLATRTRELIAATATPDLGRLGPMLAGDVGLTVLGRPAPHDKEGILGLVGRSMSNEVRVKEHSTSGISAHVDRQGTGKTLVRVRVVADVVGMSDTPNRSWWRITWRKTAEGEWQAMHIEGLQIDFVREGMLPW